MIQLTTKELSGVSGSSKVYEGVGKMYDSVLLLYQRQANLTALGLCRFILSSTNTIGDKLSSQSAELKADSASLEKKLHYLETTAKNSQQHIEKMLQSGVRG